jgi:hypothetical protein
VTDLGIDNGCLPFYAMEYVQGKNLAQILAESGPLPLDAFLDIFIQVCDGVDFAHRNGILHRDLKPANIMVATNASARLAKVLDFGLAKLTTDDRSKQSLTAVGDVFGSPFYMSPEQCNSDGLDRRSDIYSLGCTMFECLTGRPPFNSDMPSAVFWGHMSKTPPTLESVSGPGLYPQALEDVMAKVLRKDPDERYQTLAVLKADLQVIAYERTTPPVSTKAEAIPIEDRFREYRSKPNSLPPARQTWPVMPLLLGLGLVVLVCLGSFIYKQIPSTTDTIADGFKDQMPEPKAQAPLIGTTAAQPATRPTGHAVVALDATSAKEQVDDADDKWDGTPFFQGIVERKGKRYQHWCYISDHLPLVSLGYDGHWGTQWAGLSGDVYIPAAAKVSLYFRKDPPYPEIRLKALANGHFDEINFGRYKLKDVAMIAPTLAKCKLIKSIKLGDSDWSLEDSRASLDVINQFPNLQRLSFSAPCEASTLAKIGCLKQLKELRLNRSQPYLRDCWKLIAGSKEIVSLGASGWILPPSDLKLLLQFPNLEKVTIGGLTGSHEQFATLAMLPRLHELNMPALRYRPDLAADLSLIKSLKTLKCSYESNWSHAQIAELQRDLPHIQLGVTSLSSASPRPATVRRAVAPTLPTPAQKAPPTSSDPAAPLSVD